MKKILFLTRSYPDTRGSASILCTQRVIKCVAASNRYSVHVLCYRFPEEKKDEQIGDVYVHRFNPSLWMRMRNCFFVSRGYKRLNRLFDVIQKFFTIPSFPNIEPLTTRRFFSAAKQIHSVERFDMVVAEHHGLESLLTGCKLKRLFPELKHIAIMWDPVKGQMATVKLPKAYTDRRINKTEKYVADYTTLQISTLSMKEYHDMHGDMAADHRVYLDIPSILEPEAEVVSEYLDLIRKDSINIVFSGLLSEYYRDALPIIRLLGKTNYGASINLLFFSRGEKEAIEKESNSFEGSIVYHDYIPLSHLHTIYRHAEYLLNVSHINANMVPSKIFEYMSYGKPIISTYVTDGDSAMKYITRYAEGLCLDLKEPESVNISKLNAFISRVHKEVPFEEVKEHFKTNTPEVFLNAIDEII